jgi:Low-density lipoprotein receptor repeat class B
VHAARPGLDNLRTRGFYGHKGLGAETGPALAADRGFCLGICCAELVPAGALDSVPDFPAGQVDKAGLDGSNPHNLAINQNEPTGVATGSGHVYWTTLDGTILEANLDGSGAHAIVTGQAPSGLAVDSSHLYWTDVGSPQNPAGSVWEASLNGTGAHAIVTGQPEDMGQIAVGASYIYWAASTNFSDGSGAIWEANLDGTSPHAVVTGQNSPQGVAVDSSHIYWANHEDSNGNPGAIWEASLDGASPQPFIGSDNPGGVAVDGSRIYWTDSANGTINQANLDGSRPHALFGGQDDPAGITVGP